MRGHLSRRATAVLGAVVVVGAAVGIGVGTAWGSGSDGATATVTAKACAPEWNVTHSGESSTTIADRSGSIVDVEVMGADQQHIYAEIEHLNTGSDATLLATLPPGRFRLQCTYGGGSVVPGPWRTVTGPPVAARSFLAVVPDDLTGVTYTYRDEVAKRIGTLVTDTDALEHSVDSGDITQAKTRWLTAHLDYERLGAAYDTFGDSDAAIDGTTEGLAGGVNDPGWSGFFRLEYGLWGSASAADDKKVADQLASDVHNLQKKFPMTDTNPVDLPLRTHEILENALQFELTGRNDQGSHTALATVRANVDGTRMTLDLIAPELTRSSSTLVPELDSELDGLATLLDSYDVNGTWTPLQSLTTSQREHLDATIDQYLEHVEVVPDMLDIPLDTDSS